MYKGVLQPTAKRATVDITLAEYVKKRSWRMCEISILYA